MEKLSVTLTASQKAFIETQVKSGRFASSSEVLRDSIRQTMNAAYLEDQIACALGQANRGEFIDEEEVEAKIDAGLGAL